MTDLSIKYMGLELKNPIIAGSSGLTSNLQSLKDLEKHGAAAVVLKSIFEEEINLEYEKVISEADRLGYRSEELDYFDYKIKEKNLTEYLDLIRKSKKELAIPVIASINCISGHEWVNFANRCESAGADGLEVNLSIFPTDFSSKSEAIESKYFDIINQLQKKINIPVALKISPYFTNTPAMIKRLSSTGIDALVLFNRYYNPDIDIEDFKLTSDHVFTGSKDISIPLRFVSIMHNRVNCNMCGSTGIHTGEDVIKMILAGATAVQAVSVLYKKGSRQITDMIEFVTDWMQRKNFRNLEDFRGKMSQSASSDPSVYERVQFMKFFSGKFQ